MIAVNQSDENLRHDTRANRPQSLAALSDRRFLEDVISQGRLLMQSLCLGHGAVCAGRDLGARQGIGHFHRSGD